MINNIIILSLVSSLSFTGYKSIVKVKPRDKNNKEYYLNLILNNLD